MSCFFRTFIFLIGSVLFYLKEKIGMVGGGGDFDCVFESSFILLGENIK